MHLSSRPLSPRPLLALSLCLTAMLAVGVGCKNRRPDADPTETLTPLPPGADGWAALTGSLPAGSPAVLSFELSRSIGAANALLTWLEAEPAMLGEGEEGVMRVQGIRELHKSLNTSLGVDVLQEQTWEKYGVDPSQAIHVSYYPLPQRGATMVSQVEAALRERLKLAQDASIEEALMMREEAPAEITGLYGELSRIERGTSVSLGFRMVARLKDEARLFDTLDGTFDQESYVRVSNVSDTSLRRVYFSNRSEDVVVFVARLSAAREVVMDWYTLGDLEEEGREARQQRVMQSVTEVLAQTPAGAPHAPAPSSDGALALGINHSGISHTLRFLRYREAIKQAALEATNERDEALFWELAESLRQLHYWRTGTHHLTGTSYEILFGGEAENKRRFFGLQMFLFGAPGREAPQTRRAALTLPLEESGAGLSMDPRLLFGAAWRDWLEAGEDGEGGTLLDGLEWDDSAGALESFFRLAAVPRLLAQVVSTIEEEIKQEVPLEVVPIYGQREAVARVEALVPGLDLSNFWRDPRWVAVISLEPGLSALDRDAFSAALRDTLHYALEQTEEGEDAEEAQESEDSGYARAKALKAGAVMAFEDVPGSALSKMYYYYQKDGEAPFIMLAQGSEAEQALTRTLERARSAKQAPTGETFRLKLEPASLLELASTYQPAELAFFDLPILAQRLGTMLFRVTTTQRGAHPALLYRFDLLAPAALDD